MTFEKDYYETSEFWSDGALTNAGTMARIRETVELVPANVKSLLDVGCGNGIFVNALSRARPDVAVTATDRASAALAHVNTNKFESDIASIPRPDYAFDCVTCLQVMEHLTCDVYLQALKELARISGKYLIVSVPFKEDLTRDVTQCPKCRSRFNINLHLRSYDSQTIRALFEPFGFTYVLEKNISPVKKWYGQDSYVKLRRYLSQQRHPQFQSPICPVCGHRDRQFDSRLFSAAPTANPKPSVARRIVKAIWPRFEAPGYWVVALYERTRLR
jgi:ubiquinone/menaquinone biosynthesis C-methylase UbiE